MAGNSSGGSSLVSSIAAAISPPLRDNVIAKNPGDFFQCSLFCLGKHEPCDEEDEDCGAEKDVVVYYEVKY